MKRNTYVVETMTPTVVAGPFVDPREAAREAADHEAETGTETSIVAEDVVALARQHGEVEFAEGMEVDR